MGKPFALVIVAGADPYWIVTGTTLKHDEHFLGKAGAMGFAEDILGQEYPVEIVTIDRRSNRVETAWFVEPGRPKRKLYLLGEANVRDLKKEEPPELIIAQIRALGAAPCPWHVTFSNSPCAHDGCRSPEEAKEWLRIAERNCTDAHLLLVHDADDHIREAWAVRGESWTAVPISVRTRTPRSDGHLYPGMNNGTADKVPPKRPRSFRAMTIRPTGDKEKYAVAGDDGSGHTCPDHETACVWAFGQTDKYSELFLVEHDRHDRPVNAFMCLGGRWEKLPASVPRFLRRQLGRDEESAG